jgi:hypothetical protein
VRSEEWRGSWRVGLASGFVSEGRQEGWGGGWASGLVDQGRSELCGVRSGGKSEEAAGGAGWGVKEGGGRREGWREGWEGGWGSGLVGQGIRDKR